MDQEFYSSRKLRLFLWVNAILSLVCVALLRGDSGWVNALTSIAFAYNAAVTFYWLGGMTAVPVVEFTKGEVVMRSAPWRSTRRLAREEIQAVSWASGATICVQLRSGGTTTINVGGLPKRDQDAVLRRVQEWAPAA